MIQKHSLLALGLCAIALSACGGAKETFGLEDKAAPDEFAVVRRAPLALPPGYDLRPPRPGAPRPQEQSPNELAKQVIFGEQAEQSTPKQTYSSTEDLLLRQAGAIKTDPNIRQKVDAESKDFDKSKIPLGKRLLNMGSDEAPASIVDAAKESKRIRENQQDGKPVTEGETPTIDD